MKCTFCKKVVTLEEGGRADDLSCRTGTIALVCPQMHDVECGGGPDNPIEFGALSSHEREGYIREVENREFGKGGSRVSLPSKSSAEDAFRLRFACG